MAMKTTDTVLGPIAYDDRGRSDQPTAILWPSLFADHGMWDRQVESLRASGWRTIAIDPPGHGSSPGPGRDFTMAECAQVVVRLLEHVPSTLPIALLGTSWGGMIAPRVARSRPDRISGMILFNTTVERPDVPTIWTSRLLTLLLAMPPLDRLVDRILMSKQLSAETRRDRPAMVEAFTTRYRSWSRQGLIRSVRSVLIGRDAYLTELTGLPTPTLIVSGQEDTLFPAPFSRRMADLMPNARHVEVGGAAHLVPLEQPEAANSLILSFLTELKTTVG